MTTVHARIEGTSPLLMHRFPDPTSVTGHSRRPANLSATEAEAEAAAYRLPNGGLYIPSRHVLCAIRQGARQHKIGRRAAWPIIFAAVRVSPDQIPLGTDKYVTDVQSVVNQSNGSRIPVARARVDSWGLSFDLAVHDDYVPVELVRSSLADGGVVDGVGAFRALYGKFQVTEWKEE